MKRRESSAEATRRYKAMKLAGDIRRIQQRLDRVAIEVTAVQISLQTALDDYRKD